MELIAESEIYSPSISDNGNYVDKIPSFNGLKNGIRCLCGARKDKTYNSYSIFSNHIKTKCHQNWLDNLNLNKNNHYIDNVKLNEVVHNQKIIIGKMEKDINNKNIIIDLLTQELGKLKISNENNKVVTDLIDF